MRILCITSSYPRDGVDISGLFVKRWREELEDRGARVTVLTWRSPEDALEDGEAGVHRVAYGPQASELLFYGAGAPENIAANPSLLGLVPGAIGAMLVAGAKALVRERYDLIVGHWLLPGGWIARVLGYLFGVPSVVVTHSGGIDMLDRLPRRMGRALARYLAAGKLTFVSNEAKSRFFASGASPKGSCIISMGFDAVPMGRMKSRVETETDEPADGEEAARMHSHPRPLLAIGRLVPIKGIDDILHALALCPDVELHIAGDGPERERLEALASALGVTAVFHGVVRGEDKRRLLQSVELSLFASRAMDGRHEGLPVSFLECAAAGAYPLVAALPGARGLLHDPARQQLREDRDPGAWAEQIQRELASSPSARSYRALAQRELVLDLSWERLGARWYELLSEWAQPSMFSRR